MPSTDRHSRLADLFDAARELPADARERYLREQCADDAGLVAEVRDLLRFHESAGDAAPLSAPIVDKPIDVAALLHAVESEAAGKTVGNSGGADALQRIAIPGFRIQRLLGEGGMGVVYLAEQDKPRRLVAIKIMRPGATSPALLRRFDLEQEMLARLQHPGIAQIHETGMWRPFGEAGGAAQPFFVMEYVEGKPLNVFAELHELGTRDRLRLLLKVCAAVQHAHLKGVVHRDLKPANVLVSSHELELSDARGPAPATPPTARSLDALMAQPKVLDFGVARATASDMQVTTLHTGVGQLVGTLAYMSPEQATGDPSLIDARCDVYALGVMGYELLSGQLPHLLQGRPLADAARIIRDEDAAPLSVVDRVFRGDLDTIFAKALAKEAQRRYSTVAEFALDIQRYLEDQPIVARPPSAVYNLRKFARRNRGLVGGVAVAFLLLVLGVIGTTLSMLEAQRQRDDATAAKTAAETEAETAQAVTSFIEDVLGSPDPMAGTEASAEIDPKQTRIVDVLDHASRLAGERFAERPLVEAGVRVLLGRTYSHLMIFDKAEEHLRRGADIYVERTGNSAKSRDVLSALGTLYMLQHRFEEGEAIIQQTITMNREALGPTHPYVLQEMEHLAMMQAQRREYDQALQMLTDLLALRRAAQGAEHAETVNTLYNIAWIHSVSGRWAEALPIAEEVLELRQRVNGEDDVSTLTDVNNIAYLLERLDREEEAETMYSELVQRARLLLPANDWRIGNFLHNHASALRRLERYDEAEPKQLEAIACFEKSHGLGHRRTQVALRGAVQLYEAWGRPEEAAKWQARFEEATAGSGGAQH